MHAHIISCNSSFSSKKPFVFGRPLDPTSIVRNVGMYADECRFCMRSLYFFFFSACCLAEEGVKAYCQL